MRRALGVLTCLSILAACGGGGGGGGGSTPSQPDKFYVRATAGNDANDGLTPETAFRSIGAALSRLTDGDTVIVGPGIYPESILDPLSGLAAQPVRFIADPTGAMTLDAPGAVIVDATGVTDMQGVPLPAVRISGASYISIDGFHIRGGATDTPGVQVRPGSSNIVIRNCEVTGNGGDGILVQASEDVLLFNNLVYDNTGNGIVGAGSPRLRVINNTVTDNKNRGLFLTRRSNAASSNAFLRNNIIQENDAANLQVGVVAPSSLDGFDSQFNLVFLDTYQPTTLPRPSDINEDALFVDASAGNFRLFQIDSGQSETSPAVDAGVEDPVPSGPAADYASLRGRTTSSDGSDDVGQIDLGYHYSPGAIAPSPTSETYYVRDSGNDSRDGLTPDTAFRKIASALTRMEAGDIVIVGPGMYPEQELQPPGGTNTRPVVMLADPSGQRTNDADAAGAVLIDASGGAFGIRLTRKPFVIVDGFTVTRGSDAGIQVRSSSNNVTIRNCEVSHNEGDGILVQDSEEVLLFNNLSFANDERGLVVGGGMGSPRARLINNTSSGNTDRGIVIGTGAAASPDALLQNNIVQGNGNTNVQFNPASVDGASLSFNLVTPADSYSPDDLPHDNDIAVDAEFVDADGGDFHLQQSTSPAVDAGDLETAPSLRDALELRSTAPMGAPDTGRVDLGYHFPR